MNQTVPDQLVSRFVVARSTVIEKDDAEYALIFLVPLGAKLEMEPPEDTPEADAQWTAELNAARSDFAFTANQKEDSGKFWPTLGVEISADKPLGVGTVVDLILQVVAR